MATDFDISDGERADRLKTIDGITNHYILRAGGSFQKKILDSGRRTHEEHINILAGILECEVCMLQDMLRGLPTMPEKEMLKDWQEYVDYMIKEISLQLELNDYKRILITEPAYRVLRDMLYSFAQV